MNYYGLIGYPLGHSFSKEYFNKKFETEGLEDCYFELFPLEKIELFPGVLENQSLKGLAVTIPYKESVMPFLHSISDEAKSIGAVNCIEFLHGGLKGHNTDVIGFERSFTPLLLTTHKKALVLGSGGSSKAVQYILQKLHIPFLVVSRNADSEGMISYNEVNKKLLDEYTIIINCSPVGMSPIEDEKPNIPYQYVTSEHYLFDLIYKPFETLFLQEGRKKGAITKNGYDMLELQAEENWGIWTGSSTKI